MSNCGRSECIQKAIVDFVSKFDSDVVKRSIEKDEDILKAITGATKDISPRVLERQSERKEANLEDMAKEIADQGEFLNAIKAWFEKQELSQEKFNCWHKATSGKVLDIIQIHYKNGAKWNNTDVNFGKAQKIVNMTFKHLYCYKDAQNKEEYFQYCHMPLDSFVLEWLTTEENVRARAETNSKKLKAIPAWSFLNYGDEESEKTTYKEIVEHIPKILKPSEAVENYKKNNPKNPSVKKLDNKLSGVDYKGLTMLQADFLIWPKFRKNSTNI